MEERTVTTDSNSSTAPDFSMDDDGHMWTVDDGYHTVVATADTGDT